MRLHFGLFVSILLINITIGAWSVNEILSWFSKSIPFWADGLIGLFVGQFSIPIAVIGMILRVFGVF